MGQSCSLGIHRAETTRGIGVCVLLGEGTKLRSRLPTPKEDSNAIYETCCSAGAPLSCNGKAQIRASRERIPAVDALTGA